MNKLALISVSDKAKITELAEGLKYNNYDIIATGNTAKIIGEAGIDVTEVSDITGFPEIFDGRVKTLHPIIIGGILLRRDNDMDKQEAGENNIIPIDVVCINLYPFVNITNKSDVDLTTVIENIDIGGPCLIRAAAKNYKYLSILSSPEQYDSFLEELNRGVVSEKTRKKLAVAAFSHTADYDTHIANYFESRFNLEPTDLRLSFPLSNKLRYGENPHQSANIYGSFFEYFKVLHGKELSYNNIFDLVSALEVVEELGDNSCSIIKHSNPAGAAIGENLLDAFEKALRCDPVSAFGGIVAFTKTVDESLANRLNEIFLEVICAPDFTDAALPILKMKKNRRLLKQLKPIKGEKFLAKSIPGGIILQDPDNVDLIEEKFYVATDKKPGEKELKDLYFAWKVAKHTKSNAIVFAKDGATLGVGAGQMSRLDSAKIAIMKAEEHGLDLNNSAVASDAFFPFADGLLELIKCGATSVIQPGGSVRDQEVIDAANKNNVSMVFTGIRHFKH
ncbi:MAG: bifunctional phosphoribosylaminoimidazolecarboxamide formyltransferase/IMP cyclohydrolase [Ignavibacteria bacterium]|nr:MAG: bifunctional phosphoribosylaminoimidazolecarboxamide formyltransferase/IMP cyclohydrolase [Ignavibacteria bacterium]